MTMMSDDDLAWVREAQEEELQSGTAVVTRPARVSDGMGGQVKTLVSFAAAMPARIGTPTARDIRELFVEQMRADGAAVVSVPHDSDLAEDDRLAMDDGTLWVVTGVRPPHTWQTAQRCAVAPFDGAGSTGPEPTPEVAWHEIGDPGEPDFLNGWANSSAYPDLPLRFGLVAGLVIVEGFIDARAATGPAIFTLPAGYRPDRAIVALGYGADLDTDPTDTGAVQCAVGDPDLGDVFSADPEQLPDMFLRIVYGAEA